MVWNCLLRGLHDLSLSHSTAIIWMFIKTLFQNTTPCLKKNCAKLFLLELRQIFTNFDNFWQKDGKEAKIMRDALI